jgi:hypothetical protein
MLLGSPDPRLFGPGALEQTGCFGVQQERRPAAIKRLYPFAGLVSLLIIAAVPAIAILVRGSRRSGNGLDWGPQRKLLAIGISLALMFLLFCLFGYIYTSASPSWIGWWD